MTCLNWWQSLVTQFDSYGKRTALGEMWSALGDLRDPAQGPSQRLVHISPVDGCIRRWGMAAGIVEMGSVVVSPGGRERVQVEYPALDDVEAGGCVDDEGDVPRRAGADLCGDGGDGVPEPGADAGVSRLVDGQVVGAGCEKGSRRVELAVVEDGVQRNGEEVGEGGEEG